MASNRTHQVLGTIGAIKTLIENFPMSILNIGGVKYSSVIDFALDVLRALGFTDEMVIDLLIYEIFNIPSAIEKYTGNDGYYYDKLKKPTEEERISCYLMNTVPTATKYSPDYLKIITGSDKWGDDVFEYYVKRTPEYNDVNSQFLDSLEDSVKVIIADILTGILSCSINPEVPSEYMDSVVDNKLNQAIEIPLSYIDMFGLLDLSPVSDVGANYYNVENGLTVNNLYKSSDMNAFIWYVLNRSLSNTQVEINKTMWDSRLSAEKLDMYTRTTDEEWIKWLESRKNNNENFKYESNGFNLDDGYWTRPNSTDEYPLFPILKLGRGSYDSLLVQFPRQTYYNRDKDETSGPVEFNRSLYHFNNDYLRSIRIFNPKTIVTNMINNVLNIDPHLTIGIKYSTNKQIIEAKIDEIIRRTMEVDEVQTSDCFYSFSNDDLSDILRETELKKYQAKKLGDSATPAVKIDPAIAIDKINQINSSATSNEKISTIKKTVSEISAIPASGGYVEYSDSMNVNIGYNSQWLKDFINAIIRPIVQSVLSPQVMLLFVIDFHILGIVDFSKMDSLDINTTMSFIMKKMFNMVASLIHCVKDKIVQFIMKAVFKEIDENKRKYMIVVMKEKLEMARRLIEEAIACLPGFDFSKNRVLGQIDDVTYADITKQQLIPEADNKC